MRLKEFFQRVWFHFVERPGTPSPVVPDQPELVKYENGVWSFKHRDFHTVVDTAGAMLAEAGAQNFLEIGVYHPTAGKLCITIQKERGKTPAALKAEAEAEVGRLRELIAEAADGLSASGRPTWASYYRERINGPKEAP